MNENLARWQKLKDVFNAAVELAPETRAKYLADLRLDENTLFEEVCELLEAEGESVVFLQKPIAFEEEYSFIGETVGHYRIIREIGRGGMGAVFEAVREDGEFEQKAAVKLTNYSVFSDELVRRFRAERQILARLEHENIVRLLDGGITERRIPFYVMEYVEGVSITDYCRENNLEINERLELFRQVCAAVAYAHRQLIVHRDLKPSNILVTKNGQVKLLDFGIAKTLDREAQTLTVHAPFTPEYASPEQIKGENITTAADIYSLGVILYELLTEKPPHEIYGVQRGEIFRAVSEIEPLLPSTISNRKFLHGDLDNIILKSLQKESKFRYASVERFAADIESYLQGLPVEAHPQSFGYRARKFFRRNRLIVSLATTSLLLILFGASIAVWQFFAARHQQQIAEQRFNQVRKIANAVIFDYHDEIAKLEGSTKLREKLVIDAVDYLNAISDEKNISPELLKEIAVAYRKIGDVQGQPYNRNLGKLGESLENYQKSVALLEKAAELLPDDVSVKDELILSYKSFSQAEMRTGAISRPHQILQKAIALNDELVSLDSNNIERRIRGYGLKVYFGDSHEKISERIEIYKQTLTEVEKFYVTETQNKQVIRALIVLNSRSSNALRWLGDDDHQNGNFVAANEKYRDALTHAEKSLYYDKFYHSIIPTAEMSNHSLGTSYSNLAACFGRLGRYDEALKNAEIATNYFEKARTSDKFDQEAVLSKVSELNIKQLIFVSQNKPDLALENLKLALDFATQCYRFDPMNAEALSWVGHFTLEIQKILVKQGKFAEAEKHKKIFDERAVEFKEKFGKEWTFYF